MLPFREIVASREAIGARCRRGACLVHESSETMHFLQFYLQTACNYIICFSGARGKHIRVSYFPELEVRPTQWLSSCFFKSSACISNRRISARSSTVLPLRRRTHFRTCCCLVVSSRLFVVAGNRSGPTSMCLFALISWPAQAGAENCDLRALHVALLSVLEWKLLRSGIFLLFLCCGRPARCEKCRFCGRRRALWTLR